MKNLLLIGLMLTTLMAQAGVKVSSLELKSSGTNGAVVIGLDGRSSEQPDMKISDSVIELTIPGAEKFTALNKKRTLNNRLDTALFAENKDGSAVVKIILPYSLKGHTESVALTWKNNNIEIVFPNDKLAAKAVVPRETPKAKPESKSAASAVVATAAATKITKEVLDEDYLNKLVKEQNGIKKEADQAAATAPAAAAPAEDKIQAKQSSIIRETHVRPDITGGTNGFSFAGYALKFAVFLALVLGLFYGVVQVMKRGVFSRGKLGFLTNSQMIEVLSTTYVAPKRSLMVVKAHKQVFLVSNSETGLQFLSEITDTSGIIKETEKLMTGTNFDTDFDESDKIILQSKIKLKENIMESTPIKDTGSPLARVSEATKDIVKFSDELKKKARKLKPLEFN